MDRTLVREIMTTDLVSIDRNLKITQALELMHAERVRRLPVVGLGDRIVGILTEKDARLALPKAATAIGVGFGGEMEAPEVPSVQDVMTHYVHSIAPERSVAFAAGLLSQHKISGLPVVDSGRLVGIITAFDVFRYIVEQSERAAARVAA